MCSPMGITAMMQSKNNIITMKEIRAAGGCATGVRSFFKRYSLDFKAFLKNGISADVLLATGDALAVDVVNRVISNGGNNNGE